MIYGAVAKEKTTIKPNISERAEGRYCKFCGAYIGDAKFCPKCGKAQE
jgi:hypothetical protein